MSVHLKKRLLAESATAILTIVGIHAAHAQQAPAPSAAPIETVVVSGSRIDIAGFEAPTPVVVIGAEQIQRNAQLDIADEIRDLPQIRGSSANTAANGNNAAQGDAGISTLNLRNLGAVRNLVLIDGERVGSSAIQDGTVDLATIPSTLVSRVDIVTGGASAAWGSDAVTGVENIIINKTFEGIKANAEFSNQVNVSQPQYKIEGAWGETFLDGRLHTEFAADSLTSDSAVFGGQNPKNYGKGFVYNPAYCNTVTYVGATGTCTSPSGQPELIYAYNRGVNNTTQGGIINSNKAGVAGSNLAANSLKGIDFVGPGSVPTNFNYGTTYNGTTCYNGCSNDQFSGAAPWNLTAAPYHQSTYFSYTSFKITPDITASLQLDYGRFSERNTATVKSTTSQTIYADNAYLPASVAQRFVCAGTASAACVQTLSNGYNPYTMTGATGFAQPAQTLTMGFDFINNRAAAGPATNISGRPDYSMNELCSAVGQPCNYMNRATMRGVFDLTGTIFGDWSWKADILTSSTRVSQKLPNDPITARFNNAIDAVLVTPTNVGTSGLPTGTVQCRGLLNPANLTGPGANDLIGCQPLNAFGYGNVSNQAYNWINPGRQPSSGILDQELIIQGQTAAGVSVDGVLPWQLPAGPVAVAMGAEYRLEQSGQFNVSPYSIASAFTAGNFSQWEAQYHVEEGFAEVTAPVLKDYIVQSFDANFAGRLTSYSSSGSVETWKMGFTSQINDDWRLRGFYSYDIRAPLVYDLYNPGANNSQQCASWAAGGATNPCFAHTGGNPNLVPEKANTISGSIVATPHWIDGLTASLDWYALQLHGALFTPSFAQVISYAQAGQSVYCAQIITSNGSNICSYSQAPGTVVPQITQVNVGAVNANKLTTAGVDASLNYQFDLFTGRAGLSFNGSYVYDWRQVLNGVSFQGAGGNGYYGGGSPFNGNIQASYREGAWSLGMESHISAGYALDLGTEGQPGIQSAPLTYTSVNGVNVAALGSGQLGQGITSTNYHRWFADLGLRASYKLSDAFDVYGAVDGVLPGNKAYRVGVRANF